MPSPHKINVSRIKGLTDKYELFKKIEDYITLEELKNNQIINSINKISFDNNTNLPPINVDTPIAENYRDTARVRIFFEANIGKKFSFNLQFVKWMKENQHQTFRDALVEWQNIQAQRKNKGNKIILPSTLLHHQYIASFLQNNPNKTIKDAIKCWKFKRKMQASLEYNPIDISLLDLVTSEDL